MIREIERLYNILSQLRLLENNVQHEFDTDVADLRKAIRILNSFYDQMVSDQQKKQEESKKQ